MGGFRHLTADRFVEIYTEGGGGETQYLPSTFSKLYSREALLQIEREKEEPSGRRKRLRPDKLPHVGDKALGKVDLPQTMCANCGTNFLAAFRVCYECGGQIRAPSEQQIIEACRQAR